MSIAHKACPGPEKPRGEWIMQQQLEFLHFARTPSTHLLALLNKVMLSLSSVHEI